MVSEAFRAFAESMGLPYRSLEEVARHDVNVANGLRSGLSIEEIAVVLACHNCTLVNLLSTQLRMDQSMFRTVRPAQLRDVQSNQ